MWHNISNLPLEQQSLKYSLSDLQSKVTHPSLFTSYVGSSEYRAHGGPSVKKAEFYSILVIKMDA